MNNMDLWKSVYVTDPSAVKPITGKQYQGNSPKPYWIVEQATKAFGPCGIGWGVTVLDERIERFGEIDSVHIARVRVWYVYDGKRGEIEQMGQTKMSYKTNKGSIILDEDAPKKSVTDAMIKCLSLVGFAGDIFSGRWDDSGYVQQAGAIHEERRQQEHKEEQKKNLISEDQVSEIAGLISQTGTDFEQFMKWISKGVGFECKTLAEIPANAYQVAVKQLKRKLAPQ